MRFNIAFPCTSSALLFDFLSEANHLEENLHFRCLVAIKRKEKEKTLSLFGFFYVCGLFYVKGNIRLYYKASCRVVMNFIASYSFMLKYEDGLKVETPTRSQWL